MTIHDLQVELTDTKADELMQIISKVISSVINFKMTIK